MGTKRKPDWGTPRTCTICGRELKSAQALGCHLAKVHKIGRDGRPLGAPPETEPTPTPPRRTQLPETTRVDAKPPGDERPGAMLPVSPLAVAMAAAVEAFGVECVRIEIDGEFILQRRGTRQAIRLRDDGTAEPVRLRIDLV